MDPSLTIHRLTLDERLRVLAARVIEAAGWSGVLGLLALLGALAAIVAAEPPVPVSAWPAPATEQRPTPTGPTAQFAAPKIRLPRLADVPTILSRIERAAVHQGLSWPRAEYRIEPSTADKPARLALTVLLQGPYLNVRSFIGEILRDAPSLTLRNLELTRPTSDAAEVQAHLTIDVFLQSDDVATAKELR